jgi:hypothetical protein
VYHCIDVTYHLPLGTEPPTIQTTLTRPGDITALVAPFNALPRDSLEPHGCLPDTTRMTTADGERQVC